VVIFIWDKGLGAYWLLTAVANETALMPCGAGVLKLPGSCKRKRKEAFKTNNFLLKPPCYKI